VRVHGRWGEGGRAIIMLALLMVAGKRIRTVDGRRSRGKAARSSPVDGPAIALTNALMAKAEEIAPQLNGTGCRKYGILPSEGLALLAAAEVANVNVIIESGTASGVSTEVSGEFSEHVPTGGAGKVACPPGLGRGQGCAGAGYDWPPGSRPREESFVSSRASVAARSP